MKSAVDLSLRQRDMIGRVIASPDPIRGPLETALLDTESTFYGAYTWCLNAFPTLREVISHLRCEVRRLEEVEEDWQRAEVMTNVFLLSCAITDTVDDHILGERYAFSKATAVVPGLGPGLRAAEALLGAFHRVREWRLGSLRQWKETWESSIHAFLRAWVADERPDRKTASRAGARLVALLSRGLPDVLQRCRPRIPAPFRTRDLTPFDVLALGRRFTAAFPTRDRPLLVVGLRTAGSYFAPLLSAALTDAGYRHLTSVTIRPKKGLGRWEAATLAHQARQGALALVVDEPPNTGGTLAKGIDLIRQAGFGVGDIVALLPIHQAWRDWRTRPEALPLSGIRIVSLEPEEWHKRQLLQPKAVEALMAEYFAARASGHTRVVVSLSPESLNAPLQQFHTRLKRIYEVRLEGGSGQTDTRYVLAKSVGWGWLSYHAVIAGQRLAGFVPPVLGLREGILYSEWLPQGVFPETHADRGRWIDTAAAYIAERVRGLNLGSDPAPDLSRADQHRGFDLLARTLARAHGWRGTALLKSGRLQHELARSPCPVPTLIDGKVRPQEWIAGPQALLKTDFEHHGQGKHELNVTDPAYDLAEAILYLGLSEAEEGRLINRYIEKSGDAGVAERLFTYKLLAGTWAMDTALYDLADGSRSDRAKEFNRLYINAWNFLITQTVRHCGRVCGRPTQLHWHSPVVIMDIDGVLDKGVIGFPSTSEAGLRALALLHAHDIPIALNTARTLAEVKEYCRAYGFVGGVAEYGAIVWDALQDRERIQVGPEALQQLDDVRSALRRLPGIFLNDDYRYSIRAYTYERGTTVPLPTLFIRNLMTGLMADRLAFLQTHMDTAIVAKEVDKGKGMQGLLVLVDQCDSETIAIGDSEADLAMFRLATRSFAPAHISCRSVAKLLGCQIAPRAYQAGLLHSVNSILHPDGRRCERCRLASHLQIELAGRLFWELLEAADQKWSRLLLRAALDPMALRAFAR